MANPEAPDTGKLAAILTAAVAILGYLREIWLKRTESLTGKEAKSQERFIEADKRITEYSTTHEGRLWARIEALEKRLDEADVECQERLDKMQIRIDALLERIDTMSRENESLKIQLETLRHR
jgi:chromosome segregation ATPase